ncbi:MULTISPECIES: hypothetical protein [unclassified Luteimonas]
MARRQTRGSLPRTTEIRHATWREMIDTGVSMILTDNPKELARLLQAEYADRRGDAK